MSFQAPFSSSPPTTPEGKAHNGFSFGASNPSTTPAGPPPSSTGSFTPAGPPPPSFLGSSMMGTSSYTKPLSFSQDSPSPLKFGNQDSSPSAGYAKSQPTFSRSRLNQEYQASSRREPQAPSDGSYEDEEDGGEEMEAEDNCNDENSEEDEDAIEDADMDYESDPLSLRSNGRGSEERSESPLFNNSSLLGGIGRNGLSTFANSIALSVSGPKPFAYQKIATSLYSSMTSPAIFEEDELVLTTERLVSRLYQEGIGNTAHDDRIQNLLLTIPTEVIRLWESYHRKTEVYDSQERGLKIGPGEKASSFAKANFLASLALQVYHPQQDSKGFDHKVKPLPLAMLQWMNEHHDNSIVQFEATRARRPSPANDPWFWNVVFNSLLHGKVVEAVNLLKDAGWRYARGGDGNEEYGYTGVALANVEKVVGAATHILSQCPAIQGDWNIRSSDWTLFRLRASQALEDLKRFAEGRARGHADEHETFGMSSMNSRSGNYSRTARKAESQVPWHIYQQLVTLYSLVIGDREAIITGAEDWCEATIGLLLWWDETRDERRLALGRSQTSQRVGPRDSDPKAYLYKLRKSFESATSGATDFQVNTLDYVEVGLASLLEGDSASLIGFLRGWSGPVSCAIAEIASLGGWLARSEPQSLINMDDLDQDDMDLLGVKSSPSKSDGAKDQTLIAYARALVQKKQLRVPKEFSQAEHIRNGWEIAIVVLGRLDSAARSEEMVGDLLNGLALDSSDTVDKIWRLLNDVGMDRHADTVAETYAEGLANNSHKYGEALWYYSLAHKPTKVKDVLDLLISYSLIQSVAFPPEAELDDHLRRLVSSPKTALAEMSKMDADAAELLHKTLSGYATLRIFYTIRDRGVLAAGTKPSRSLQAQKSEAISALMAVISSSDDNIRGGLYDEKRGAVVSVDFLLALLGEAMIFVNQPGFPIRVLHIEVLTKAIEDLQTVGPRVYSACTEFLQTVIASAQGLKGSSPADMLKKSSSSMSGTSSFSMVGSSMLASQLKQSMGSSGVLVKGNVKRGWDWRQTVSAGTSAEDILRVLRLGLAQDLAKSWLAELDNVL